MKRVGIYILGIMALLLAGCDEQRDLYGTSSPMLYVEGDWVPSLGKQTMLDATIMLYKDGGVTKEFFSRPNGVTVKVSNGRYDMLVINGVMESEDVTNLNHIYFRGTDRLETFEALVAEGYPNSRLSRADGEYIASNEMEILTFAYNNVSVEGKSEYYLKYRNGHNGYPVVENHVESKIELRPRAVSYRFQVKMTNLVNPRSASSVCGALRGFAGSVFMTSPEAMPKTGFSATHHLNFTSPSNDRRVRTNEEGKETGTIQSPVFVSFGPQLPERLVQLEHSGKYMLELSIILTDNTEFKLAEPIDITEQVNDAIGRILHHHEGKGDITIDDNLFVIEIKDRIELPVVAPENVVDVTDWEDDQEIIVWMKQ